MDSRLPLAAASVCLLVLTAFWISSAPGTIPDDVRYTTRSDLQRITRQGGFGSERVNPMAAAMALLHPQASKADSYAWADAPGQGRPLRPALPTPWSNKVDPQQPLPEYPRPQMVRKQWFNLNGVWEFEAIGQREYQNETFVKEPRKLSKKILVPFPVESPLSGVQEHHAGVAHLLYKRMFEVPKEWHGQRIMLRFGAVDYEAKVFVNGKRAGMHRGGFDKFAFDVTDLLLPGGQQALQVAVYDPTEFGHIALGKQRLHPPRHPSSIWYTSNTGIWQTVWLEPVRQNQVHVRVLKPPTQVPAAHITRLDLIPDIDSSRLHVTVQASDATHHAAGVRVMALLNGTKVAAASGMVGSPFDLPLRAPLLWTPEQPNLYDLHVELVSSEGGSKLDAVDGYFGMRKISLGRLPGERWPRLFLNNEFVFQMGLLDQGYWPDGIYTAPTDEALAFDIRAAKAMGYNLLRKHIKVEPDRWYYHADRLGMLIWQDHPSMFWEQDAFHPGEGQPVAPTHEEAAQWEREYVRMVEEHYSFPCIVVYVVFNEAWGQYDTVRVTREMRALDRSRLWTPASGWDDADAGDIIDMHKYVGPDALQPTPTRASVLGEFGGLGFLVEGHQWIPGDSFNYEMQATQEQLEVRYLGLVGALRQLVTDPDRCLSAAVYTELTDVEAEVNGWLTYDRSVNKMLDTWAIPGAHQALLELARSLNPTPKT